MKYVSHKPTEKHANSPNCMLHEYPMQNSEMSIAVAKIIHRYRDEAYAINHKCGEMGYILRDSGKLVTEAQAISLSVGDVVYVPSGEKYYWERNITVILLTTPAWYPQQHQTHLPGALSCSMPQVQFAFNSILKTNPNLIIEFRFAGDDFCNPVPISHSVAI